MTRLEPACAGPELLLFLNGGGKTGAMMRAHDWAHTPLGPPEGWSATLKSSVALMLNSRFPMFLAWGPTLTFLYNDDYIPVLGAKHPDALGKPFAEVWQEIWNDLRPLVERALSGEATFHENLPLTMLRSGSPEQTYFTFSYSALRDADGNIAGMFCACRETTSEVMARDAIRAEQDRLRDFFWQAPGFMALLDGPDHVFSLVNAAYEKLVGRRDLVGKPVRQALPDVKGQGFFELLDRVFVSGEPYVGRRLQVRLRTDDGKTDADRFVDFVYQPVRDAANRITGIFVEGMDVTDVVQSEAALKGSEERLRIAQRAGQVGSFEVVPATGRLFPSEEFCRLWGLPPIKAMPVSDAIALIEKEDRGAVLTGRPNVPEDALRYIEYRIRRPSDGALRWIARRGEVIPHGDQLRYVGVTYDITERKEVEAALQVETEALETLNRMGREIAAELDVGRLVQTVTDASVVLTKAAFGAFFYNVIDEKGERYTLYAISGVEREAFSKFPMPRKTSIFGPTFDGAGVLRSDDITQDKRYGHNHPHHGMPEGHLPVRSYLAAPVMSRTGEVLGGLFLGHPQPAVFDERSERLIVGVAGQVATAIDNARLFEAAQREIGERKRAEGALQSLNQSLEELIDARTKELRQNQEALHQASKMEAVGQLTGGIAHDFNNLLTGVIGSLDLLRTRIRQGRLAESERYIHAAMNSARRAAALTHRLLAFSRRQPLDPKPTRPNELILSMEDLLRRTMGPSVSLEVVAAGGLWATLCDPNQLESAILNLAINARDAMPDGGRLVIESANAHLDRAYAAREPDLTPGQYVAICVTDTGNGMPPTVIAKAFDPFFTTKPVGQGTGLGLSMVYGFAKQSGGHAAIYSEPGQGTTVKIYLPRHYGDITNQVTETASTPAFVADHAANILVVEDEPVVRDLVVEVLQDCGFQIKRVSDGPSALKVLDSSSPLDLLVTDIGLPGGMNGRQLADEARRRRPDLKILFMTGYAENAAIAAGFLEPGMEMITKPFAGEQLAAKAASLLRG